MIKLKSERDLGFLRIAGRILVSVLEALKNEARAGVTLFTLDEKARRLIKKAGARPAFLGYQPEGGRKPYPAAVCVSINEKIVHGLPSGYILKEGDVLKIDIGVDYQGYFTDAALTVGIGRISREAESLINVTRQALNEAVKICRPSFSLGDIGWAIEKTVSEKKFSVIKGLTGHGIGLELHEDPVIYNYGRPGEGVKLTKGMVLAVEPMVSAGSGEIKQEPDESFVTKDKSLSAHFEQTIAITEESPEILTPF